MADVRIGIAAGAAADPVNKARLVAGGLSVTLPWWPTDIGWDSLASNWTEQNRPGRDPLLLRESQTLPEITIGCIVANADSTYVGDGGSVLTTLSAIDSMAIGDEAVQLILASRATGRWRITNFSFTELEHDTAGNPTRAEVALTLKRAEDVAAPIGPVKNSSKGKKKGR